MLRSAVHAVGMVLLMVTNITESLELKVVTTPEFNISAYVGDNGELVGNVNVSQINGDLFTGKVVRTEQGGIQAKGRGMMVYGINGLIYKGNFDHGNPSGRGLMKMPLPGDLETSTLSGCCGCIQEMSMDGQWWLTVDGNTRTGNGWIIVATNSSQHTAVMNVNDGRYAFGTMTNGRFEETGFLKVYQRIYSYSGPLFQKCPDIKGYPNPDEDKLSSNFTESLTSYWTNMSSYEGEFSNGNPHGLGRMRLGTGEMIEGQFYLGKPVCTGTVTFINNEDCKKMVAGDESLSAICNQGDEPRIKAFFVGGVPAIWLENYKE